MAIQTSTAAPSVPAGQAQEPENKIVIPSLPKAQGSPEIDPNKTQPLTPGPAPTKTPEPIPEPLEAPGEAEPITDIIAFAEKGAGKKPSDFAKERVNKKNDLQHKATDLETQLAQERLERQRIADEHDRLKLQYEEAERQRTEYKSLIETKEKEMGDFEERYFERHRAQVNPLEDEKVIQNDTLVNRLMDQHLPRRVNAPDGTERPIFWDQIMKSAPHRDFSEKIMTTYAQARQQGDARTMDVAIQSMAQMLGADVAVTGNPDTEKLLSPSDPTYQRIEQALEASRMPFVDKVLRSNELLQNAPVEAERRFKEKTSQIRSTLAKQVFMSEEDAAKALQVNPANGIALVSRVCEASPHMRQRAEAIVSKFAEAIASVPKGMDLPILASRDPAAVKAHRDMLQERQSTLGRMMQMAVIGELTGDILAVALGERDAAVARAERAGANTNPGIGLVGRDGAPPPVQVETDIMAVAEGRKQVRSAAA